MDVIFPGTNQYGFVKPNQKQNPMVFSNQVSPFGVFYAVCRIYGFHDTLHDMQSFQLNLERVRFPLVGFRLLFIGLTLTPFSVQPCPCAFPPDGAYLVAAACCGS